MALKDDEDGIKPVKPIILKVGANDAAGWSKVQTLDSTGDAGDELRRILAQRHSEWEWAKAKKDQE